jgi:hypothetical protein
MKLAPIVLLVLAACARQTSLATDGAPGGTGGSAQTTADAAPCPPECFRAVRCVTACGGTPVSMGCCPCTAPAFDDIRCPKPGAR